MSSFPFISMTSNLHIDIRTGMSEISQWHFNIIILIFALSIEHTEFVNKLLFSRIYFYPIFIRQFNIAGSKRVRGGNDGHVDLSNLIEVPIPGYKSRRESGFFRFSPVGFCFIVFNLLSSNELFFVRKICAFAETGQELFSSFVLRMIEYFIRSALFSNDTLIHEDHSAGNVFRKLHFVCNDNHR